MLNEKFYERYESTTEYKKLSNMEMENAGYICEKCSTPASHVYQISYERPNCDWEADLLCLCESCHEIKDNMEKLLPRPKEVDRLRTCECCENCPYRS